MKLWKNTYLCFFKCGTVLILLLRATGPCHYRKGTRWGQPHAVCAPTPGRMKHMLTSLSGTSIRLNVQLPANSQLLDCFPASLWCPGHRALDWAQGSGGRSDPWVPLLELLQEPLLTLLPSGTLWKPELLTQN